MCIGCVQGFTDPLRFDPDRFSTERQEDVKFGKNFMAFGSGPHYCVGKEYAINHLTAFLAILSTRQGLHLRFPSSMSLNPTMRWLPSPSSNNTSTWPLHKLSVTVILLN